MITAERLHQKFHYKDGVLYHKKNWGPVKAGDVAGTKTSNGYVRVNVDGKIYLAHRLIFCMHNGYFPKEIDHVNRIKHDNRIENLKEVCRVQNARNKSIYKTNKTGYRNVNCMASGKYEVSLKIRGRRTYIGVFEDVELAGLVAQEARAKLHADYPILKADVAALKGA